LHVDTPATAPGSPHFCYQSSRRLHVLACSSSSSSPPCASGLASRSFSIVNLHRGLELRCRRPAKAQCCCCCTSFGTQTKTRMHAFLEFDTLGAKKLQNRLIHFRDCGRNNSGSGHLPGQEQVRPRRCRQAHSSRHARRAVGLPVPNESACSRLVRAICSPPHQYPHRIASE
jgi:hypothetical protein